jgi:hypothetical protein
MSTSPDDELPDTRLFWRWVGLATRPVAGWVLVAIGVIAIVIGYIGVATNVVVAKQLPYLISGGILGVAVVAVGVMFLGTEEIRRDSGRLDRLERMVVELHTVLLAQAEETGYAPAPGEADGEVEQQRYAAAAVTGGTTVTSGATNGTADAGQLVALPTGERYHLADCRVVQGKPGATTVSPRAIRRRSLTPCPLCEPSLATS